MDITPRPSEDEVAATLIADSATSSPPPPSLRARLRWSSLHPSIPLKYLIALSAFGLSMDQNLLAPSLSTIAKDFGMSDLERDQKIGGGIAFAFFSLGAPASLMIGVATDKMRLRRDLFAATVLVGSCATMGSGFARNFEQLFWTRGLAGVAAGGMMPVAFSLLADLFPPSKRPWVAGALGTTIGCGVGAGQNLAGLVGPWLGWRAPFLITAVPPVVVAVVTFLFSEEPMRGAMDCADKQHANGDSATEREQIFAVRGAGIEDPSHERRDEMKEDDEVGGATMFVEELRALFTTPSVLLAFIQGMPGCVPHGIINTFLNDYLAVDQGLGTTVATLVGTTMGIGGMVGSLAGGAIGHFVFNRNKSLLPVFMGVAAIAGAFPFLILLNLRTPRDNSTDDEQHRFQKPSSDLVALYLAVAFVSGIVNSMTGNNVRAMLQNTTRPRGRGTGFAIFALSDDLGRGLGPLAVALLITANGGDRRPAFNVATLGWLVCGAVNVAAAFTIEKDCDRVVKYASNANSSS